MGTYSFVTNRAIENRAGEETGKVVAFVLSGETTAKVKYTCAECRHTAEMTQLFKRPFAVRCQKCSFLMKLPKLKGKKKK